MDNFSPDKLVRLKRMRRSALGLLLLMAALFVAARLGMKSQPSLEWLQAFAEAAMVGAMADWFAVVALFRHPFGLPIPHTAILQARKAHIARTLGAFVSERFLTREVLLQRLQGLDLVGNVFDWGRREAETLSAQICRFVPSLLESVNSAEVTEFIHDKLKRQVEDLPLAPVAGRLLKLLTENGKHEVLLDEILRQSDRLLLENVQAIQKRIADNLPLPDWPGVTDLKESISEYIADKLVSEVQAVLHSASSDRNHPLRRKFTARVEQLVTDLKESPEYLAKGEALKKDFLNNPALRTYAGNVWTEVRTWIEEQTRSPQSGLQVRLTEFLKNIADSAAVRETALAGGWNEWMREVIALQLERHRARAAEMIELEVISWDGDKLASTLETEVGADLQFIRINGTLIGGLVGLAIHALAKLLP